MTPVARGALAFVLVAGAGPAGFLIYHTVFKNHPLPAPQRAAPVSAPLGSEPSSAPPVGKTTADAAAQSTQMERAVPLRVPDGVTLPDSNGEVHALSAYRGHPLVLNFWATWCEPCQREIPLLQALHVARGTDVQIVGVAVDFQKDVLPYARTHGITYPLLMGERDGLAAVKAFGMDTAFPFTVFADSRGDIVAVKVGELHADEAQLILAEVTAVDDGKVPLDEGRAAVSAGLRSLAIARAQQPGTALPTAAGKS